MVMTELKMFGVRSMDLHEWRYSECGGVCERVYRADEVDAQIERMQGLLNQLGAEYAKARLSGLEARQEGDRD